MELILVRHALPQTARGIPADPGLTEVGRAQAAAVAAWLRHEQIDVLLSSPARRCRETAQPLVEALGLPLGIDPGLAEFDAESDEYVPTEQILASGDHRAQALLRGEFFGCADPAAFRRTVVAACEAIVVGNPGRRVVAFTHGGTINVWTGHLVGARKDMWFSPGYTAISRTAGNRTGSRGIVSLNETPHLHPAATSAPAGDPAVS